mmetsp:Transcript_16607/g.28167  ORF Transcript_16607/g.28167 Transcript_16607/m.28167 type:complete len:224 (+) Transcript_16607:95-766(+)
MSSSFFWFMFVKQGNKMHRVVISFCCCRLCLSVSTKAHTSRHTHSHSHSQQKDVARMMKKGVILVPNETDILFRGKRLSDGSHPGNLAFVQLVNFHRTQRTFHRLSDPLKRHIFATSLLNYLRDCDDEERRFLLEIPSCGRSQLWIRLSVDGATTRIIKYLSEGPLTALTTTTTTTTNVRILIIHGSGTNTLVATSRYRYHDDDGPIFGSESSPFGRILARTK